MSPLEKHMLKELLLVCSALGSVEAPEDEGDGAQRFVRGENCLEWLQDLQRALRRDDDNTRDICVTVSSWRVVQQKLIPLVLECRDDAILVKTLLKIFVMLTMPLSKQAQEALGKPVNPKAEGDVRDQQARRRENALAQQAALHAFKRAFISLDFMSVIVGLLEEPLSHTGVLRTEEDNFSIELCLTLLRNILNITDPAPGAITSLGEHYSQMHEQLVVLFQDALLLDILLLLAQDVHARENMKLNLLLVEIFHFMIRDQEPGAIIAVHRAKLRRDAGKRMASGPSPSLQTGVSLTGVLAREKSKRGQITGQMHRFGGTLQIGGGLGTAARMVANPFKEHVDCVPQASRKKAKGGKAFTIDDVSVTPSSLADSPKAILAREALFEFSAKFLMTAYDPFMRSIKNEFRIDSSRLQPEDKGMMFRLMYFFMSFHHQRYQSAVKDVIVEGKTGADSPKFELGHVLETMDLMSFNLVLREVETAITEKNAIRLGDCVMVLKEMMYIVTLLNESSERAHQLVALGLLARIFYASEPLDKLHAIVRFWQPGKHTKSFLCHLVELVHTTLKALDWYRKGKARNIGGADEHDSNKADVDKAVRDRAAAAREFNFEKYFGALVTNTVVRMYSSLLEHYGTNSARTNHYILSFMMRLSTSKRGRASKKRRVEISPVDATRQADADNYEAVLYNVYTLGVFQKILDDPTTRKPAFKLLVQYILSVVRHFGELAQKNQLLFVEALLQHRQPISFCGTLTSVYGNGGHDDAVEVSVSAAPFLMLLMNEQGSVESVKRARSNSTTSGEDVQAADADEGVEEEWKESQPNTESPEQEDDERSPAQKSKKTRKRRHRGSDETSTRLRRIPTSTKKRARRWTNREDEFLKEAYPRYAGTSSAFAVLGMDDEMEANDRTEEQIEARVKKLGLLAAGGDQSAEDDSDDDEDKIDANATESAPPSGEDGAASNDDSVEGPKRVRTLRRKSQEQSDDDSDAFFAAEEDIHQERNDRGRPDATSSSHARNNGRPIFEDSDSD